MLPVKVSVIYEEDSYNYGKPHRYEIRTMIDEKSNYKILGDIHFQEGPYEAGINGITEMDLMAVIIARLKKIQETEEVCIENAQSIIFLEEALTWQRKKYGLKVAKPEKANKEEKKENEQKGRKKPDTGSKSGRAGKSNRSRAERKTETNGSKS